MSTKFRTSLAIAIATSCSSPPAIAQSLETAGVRASTMSAFVAVADDASAAVWNPSGLINGPFFNVLVDFGQTTSEPELAPPVATSGAGRRSASMIAFGVPPLAFSYYRTRLTKIDAADEVAASRQNGQLVLRTLVTTSLGVTVLQSLGDHVTVGATAKVVRGSLGAAVVRTETWGDAFDAAERLASDAATKGDVDLGATYSIGRMRLGLLVRNLAEPTFETEQPRRVAMSLDRHVRTGLAWGDRWPGVSRWIVAVDADLTRVQSASGERRDVAVGGERWFRNQRVGVRGGARISTVGDARAVASAGGSIAVRNGLFADLYAARGRADDRAWGIAARLTY